MSKVITDNTMSAIVALWMIIQEKLFIENWLHVQTMNFSKNTVNRSHRLQMCLKTNLALNYKRIRNGT